jgi:hypothetical protein
LAPIPIKAVLPQGWARDLNATVYQDVTAYVHTLGWRVIFDEGNFKQLAYLGYPAGLKDFIPRAQLMDQNELLRYVSDLHICPAVTSEHAHTVASGISQNVSGAHISLLPRGFGTLLAVNSKTSGSVMWYVESSGNVSSNRLIGRSAACSIVVGDGVIVPMCDACTTLSSTLSRKVTRTRTNASASGEKGPASGTRNDFLSPQQQSEKLAALHQQNRVLQRGNDRLREQRDARFQALREESIEVCS